MSNIYTKSSNPTKTFNRQFQLTGHISKNLLNIRLIIGNMKNHFRQPREPPIYFSTR